MSEVRRLKAELTQARYPPGETRTFAARLYERGRDAFDGPPERGILFLMPSTTGRNTLPLFLADRIQADRPDMSIANENSRVAASLHRQESKKKSRYDLRIGDHRRYSIQEGRALQDLRQEVRMGRPLIILDDVISTGESIVTLAKSLHWAGATPSALTAGLTTETLYPTVRQLERLYDKLKDRPMPAGYSHAMLRRDIEAFFGSFPRWKAGHFERDLSWNASLKNDPTLAIRYVQTGARNLALIEETITRGLAKAGRAPGKALAHEASAWQR